MSDHKERPILFTGPLVNAILKSDKTQTRRVIRTEWWRCLDPEDPDDRNAAIKQCPYGQPGDRLWIRETFRYVILKSDLHYSVNYKAGGWKSCKRHGPKSLDVTKATSYEGSEAWPWKPSIHMPRWASRLTLAITNVRVERLQDISTNDALAEGVNLTPFWMPNELNARPFGEKWWDDFYFWTNYPQLVFQRLWDSLNARRGYPWTSNPWVWVIEFKSLSV